MISVDEALSHVLALAAPLDIETIPLKDAAGRVLAQDIVARRDQPPFPASVMDGYAVAGEHPTYRVVGEAAAGHAFDGVLEDGEAVRIFTGAPIPDNATRVIIQEDVDREDDRMSVKPNADPNRYIRDKGMDFSVGDRIQAPCHLTATKLALCASMNVPDVRVYKRPVVAVIATGDELVMPGEAPSKDQIIASNSFGLAAMLGNEGADARMLPIARDTEASLEAVLKHTEGADLIVTIGGASVGDHDLVGQVAAKMGLERAFYKIAMRPGKPLMAGRLGKIPMIGLPGNPVSSMVCGHVFLRPMLRSMQGLPKAPLPTKAAPLAAPVGPNGPREHFMRGLLSDGEITIFERQDSSLLSVLAAANVLVIRPKFDAALEAGTKVAFIEF